MAVAVSKRMHYAERQRDGGAALDLARAPIVGRLLRWPRLRLALQVPLFLVAAVLILHGLFGPDLAPKNLATLVTWVHYRGLLVLVLLVAGNFFCMACPFLLPRELARRVFRPTWSWPQRFRNKWAAVVLFVAILFVYELFGLWSAPAWTAGLILAYFALALAVDAVFKHASFCKWLCPIGQFNFLASTLSPLEVRVRDAEVCTGCRTKDCIRGRPAAPQEPRPPALGHHRTSLPVIVQRGCELALFQPLKVGNLDCTFCLDCVHACPHDNVGVMTRLPGAELWAEGSRSGVGEPHRRADWAVLSLVFTFGALLNAFGMVTPVYALEKWLSDLLGVTQRGPILAILFIAGLVVEPAVLLGVAAWTTRRLTRSRQGLLAIGTRFAVSLVPLGFGVWLAHYAFHFLTGILTIVPVTQNALVELGLPLLGEPAWSLGGMRAGPVMVLERGLLALGLVGSWIVALRLARVEHPQAPWRAALPWLALHAILWAAAMWLLAQPMEMRGTFLGG
jgi:polyferredoxin